MAEGERRVSAIHQSLTQPILLGGAERPLAIANWIAAAALTISIAATILPAQSAARILPVEILRFE